MRRPLLNMAKLPSQRAGFAVGRWVLLGPSQVSTCKVVLPARSRAGIQAFSKRKPGRKESRGRSPAPPFFKATRSRSFCFWLCATLPRLWDYFGPFRRTLIWILSFSGIEIWSRIFSQKISPKKKVPKSGARKGHRKSLYIVPAAPPNAKGERAGASGHRKRGSRGLAPGPLSPQFSGEMGAPPGRRATGRCAPRPRKSPDYP